jgi:replicative DNA helicase
MNQGVQLDGNTLYHVAMGKEALVEAISVGIRPEYLDGKAGQAFAFAVQHHAETDKVPSTSDLQSLFGTDCVVQTNVDRSFIYQEVMKRAMFRHLDTGVAGITKRLQGNDPYGAYADLKGLAVSTEKVKPKHSVPTPLFSLGADVKASYELIESGAIGIPSPWPSLNAMTMGWWPKTNNWVVARPGTGKTWIQIVAADFAQKLRYDDGGKVVNTLIISPEMSKAAMAERFFTTRAEVGYGQVVGATLGAFGKKKYYDAIDKLAEEQGIWILDATDGLTPERIEEAIDQVEAHLVVIDSVYKIKWSEKAKDRFENMYIGVDTISSWSKRDWRDGREISILAASQMNRAGAGKKGSKQTSVALADNLNWEADNLFFVEQTEDMKADKRLRLITGKVRRMADYKPTILLRWDMDTMDFSEVPEVKKKPQFKDPGFDDSPF